MSIAFVVVKLNIYVKIQHSQNGLFGRFLGPYCLNITEIITIGSTLENKNTVCKYFEGFEFLWKRDRFKASFLVQL